jgi:hypothetical protein
MDDAMSMRSRDILTVFLVLLLVLASFAAGFFVNDFLAIQTGQNIAGSREETFAVFWEAWGKIEQSYIGDLPGSTEMTYAAIRGAVGILGDP